MGVNDRGEIVGNYNAIGGTGHGFLKEGSTFTHIDFPEATTTFAAAINNKGQIVGSYLGVDGTSHGFIFSQGAFSRLDVSFPGATLIGPLGINDLGEIVGTYNQDRKTFGFLAKPERE